MLKKLQNRFTLITMAVLCGVFALVLGSVMTVAINASQRQSDRTLEQLARNIISPDPPQIQVEPPEEAPAGAAEDQAAGEEPAPGADTADFSIAPGPFRGMELEEIATMLARSFSARVAPGYQIYDLQNNMEAAVSEEEAFALIRQAAESGKKTGEIENMKYLIENTDDGMVVVFMDRSMENHVISTFFSILLFVIGCALVGLYFIVRKLAGIAIRPVGEAFERQRRFISDASHELKTPIAIISSNADVLEADLPGNKWLNNIKDQSQRMDNLVRELLTLAKTDEMQDDITLAEFDLSAAVLGAVLPFESVAFEQGKEFYVDIQENLRYTGNEEGIRQVVSILADNAIKHAEANGVIKITLHEKNNKKRLEVYNTGMGISEGEQEKIFERFYRSDTSRSRHTGGYGLGLSIAQSTVQLHKGKISVDSEPGQWVRFTVLL